MARKILVSDSGKLLVNDGKLADPDCCCDCPINFDRPDPDSDYDNPDSNPDDPPYYCVQVIKFSFNVDASEEEAGGQSGDFVDFGDTGFGLWADWEARMWDTGSATLPMGDAPIAGKWHKAQLIILFNRKSFEWAAPGSLAFGNVKVRICVDGVLSDASEPFIPTSEF